MKSTLLIAALLWSVMGLSLVSHKGLLPDHAICKSEGEESSSKSVCKNPEGEIIGYLEENNSGW